MALRRIMVTMDLRHTELSDCGDCAVPPGTLHMEGCDVARCAITGRQQLQCSHKNCNTIWTGIWPGTAECIEYGWYSRWTDKGWQECGPNDEGAGPDLNRLNNPFQTVWDRRRQRFVPRVATGG